MRKYLPFLVPAVLITGLVCGQLFRIEPFSGSRSGLIGLDLSVIILSLYWLIGLARQRRLRDWLGYTWRHPVWRWTIWFLIWAAVSLALNLSQYTARQDLVAFSYLLRLAGFFLLGWLATYVYRRRRPALPRWITTAGAILLGLGILQLIYVPNFRFMRQLGGWDPHRGRMLSTFYDPNYFGVFLGLLMVLSLVEIFRRGWRSWWAVLFTFSWIGLFLTVSRSAWIAGLLAVVGYALRRSWRLALLFLVIFIGVLFLPTRLSQRFARTEEISSGRGLSTAVCDTRDPKYCDVSGSARVLSYRRVWKLIETSPVIGAGYNAYGYALVKHDFFPASRLRHHSAGGSDSSLLNIWATTGVVGLLLFLGFLGSVLWALWRASARDQLAAGLLAFSLAWIAASFFNNSLLYPSLLVPWLLLVAGVLAAPGRKGSSGSAA